MKPENWKVIAIVFIILFILENSFFGWALWVDAELTADTNECYYDICADYPDAQLIGSVCTCYDKDLMGNSVAATTKVIK